MTAPTDRDPRTAARSVAEDAPVFVISVAAELAGMHAQTLRQYDRLGLVSPGRTPGVKRKKPLAASQVRSRKRLGRRAGGRGVTASRCG